MMKTLSFILIECKNRRKVAIAFKMMNNLKLKMKAT